MRRFMPHIVAALAALTVFSVTVFAADLAAPPAPAKPVVVAVEAPAFHGLYIGAQAGLAAGRISTEDGFRIPRDGYTAGGFIGYNHRVSGVPGLLVGGEVDLAVTDVSGSSGAGGFTIRGSSKVIASARARAGVVFGPALIYGTGGMAQTNAKLEVTDVGHNEQLQRGIVFGGGIESMLLGNIGLRIEALRYQWDDRTFRFDGVDTRKIGARDTHVRVGLVIKL